MRAKRRTRAPDSGPYCAPAALPPEALRWRCDPSSVPFETTAEVEPVARTADHPHAVEALRYAMTTDAPGQNAYVRGLIDTGRRTLVMQLLEELSPKCCEKHDRCYVRNFGEPARPRLITLPPGTAHTLRRRMQAVAEFVRDDLPRALSSEVVRARAKALEDRERTEVEAVTGPFEEELAKAGLALVTVQLGPVSKPALLPISDGHPVAPDAYEKLRAEGRVTDEQHVSLEHARESFEGRLHEVFLAVADIRTRYSRHRRQMLEESAGAAVSDLLVPLRAEFPGADVAAFLDELEADVAEHAVDAADSLDPLVRYGVNVLLFHEDGDASPIVVENAPTMANLLGVVDREWTPHGVTPGDHMSIRGGSILRADGGFLILDARDVLQQAGAWRALVRTLRSAALEIVPPELAGPFWQSGVKPEPIPVRMRVILIGDWETYGLLDQYDPDFRYLFKVLADVDSAMERDPEGPLRYGRFLARLCREDRLLPFSRDAVAALVEHGARIAAHGGKLTTRYGRVADIAREAEHLARDAGRKRTEADDVREAVRRTKRRADLPSRHFQELLRDGTIRVQTRGAVVGQVNGLAVMTAGPLTYGFPARITASVGAGPEGIIDVEGRAALGGAIHTKGFHILGGLVRHLLRAAGPLGFSASLAFEQSYGGIDGDSASAAEACCLISGLTGIPLRQDLALTGAIDQHGAVQAIGGVNEKVEGFFDCCRNAGLTGTQGVIVPRANAADLMLRHDVVAAAHEGRFQVYAIDRIEQALELLTGVPAGTSDDTGEYPAGTLLGVAVERARQFAGFARPPDRSRRTTRPRKPPRRRA